MKYVSVSQDVRNRIIQETGMTPAGLWKALNFVSNGDMSLLAREKALAYGGEVRCDLPECETIHDAEGRMLQTMPNGAMVICEKSSGEVRVEYKGTVVSIYPDARISTLTAAQELASKL